MAEPAWWGQVKDSIEGKLGEEEKKKIIIKTGPTNIGVTIKEEYAINSRNRLFNINMELDKRNKYFLIIGLYKRDRIRKQLEPSILTAFGNVSEYPQCYVDFDGEKILQDDKYNRFIDEVVAAIRYFLNPPKEFAYSALDDLYHHHKCIVLYGPPGTGKTFIARRLAARIMGLKVNENDKDKDITFEDDKKDDNSIYFQRVSEKGLSTTLDKYRFRKEKGIDTGQWALVQFHPSYNHEDFVRGISVETPEGTPVYEVKDRILARMAEAAMVEMIAKYTGNDNNQKELHDKPLKELIPLYHQIQNKEKVAEDSKKFVLIIDEINRASLASILGELIYGLEYRGEAIRLPHALKDGTYDFLIPENLYIIGTMNTADRTIGSIDYAVRRRFAFFQCPALENVIDAQSKGRELFKLINKILTHKRNGGYGFVSPLVDPEDIRVGHSYFICKNDEELWFNMKYKVLPLLVEYYRDGLLLRSHKVENYLESFKKAFREASDFSDASERIKSLINKMEGGLRDGEN